MIKKLIIQNFKSHKNTEIDLSSLTVIAGQNGVGKSSVIQSLLLLRQTHLKNRLDKILLLNDPLCYLGRSEDIIYQRENQEYKDLLNINLSDETSNYKFSFNATSESGYLFRNNNIEESTGFEKLSLFSTDFQYISAHRNTEYETNDYEVRELKQISYKEGKGELVAQFLSEYGKSMKVLKQLCHKDENDEFLLSQITAWEREISTNVNVVPIKVGDNYDVRYSFDTDDKILGTTAHFSKKNVGFGLSYSLPIIVAILSAKKDALIIIENPEAHLHPYGISKLTELICLAAEAGIQVIIETHSDHVINGILVQCKHFEQQRGGISMRNIKMYHFDRDETEHKTLVKEAKISEGGKLFNRPPGFFDQTGKDLRILV